jgi:hypothetical protein
MFALILKTAKQFLGVPYWDILMLDVFRENRSGREPHCSEWDGVLSETHRISLRITKHVQQDTAKRPPSPGSPKACSLDPGFT